MNITRRKLATMAAAPLIVAVATPGTAEAQAADTDEETRSAHDLLRTNSEALAKVKIPIATEPAFHFKA